MLRSGGADRADLRRAVRDGDAAARADRAEGAQGDVAPNPPAPTLPRRLLDGVPPPLLTVVWMPPHCGAAGEGARGGARQEPRGDADAARDDEAAAREQAQAAARGEPHRARVRDKHRRAIELAPTSSLLLILLPSQHPSLSIVCVLAAPLSLSAWCSFLFPPTHRPTTRAASCRWRSTGRPSSSAR